MSIVLTCSEAENVRRMTADNRDTGRLERTLATRHIYENLSCLAVDTTNMTVEETVEWLLQKVKS